MLFISHTYKLLFHSGILNGIEVKLTILLIVEISWLFFPVGILNILFSNTEVKWNSGWWILVVLVSSNTTQKVEFALVNWPKSKFCCSSVNTLWIDLFLRGELSLTTLIGDRCTNKTITVSIYNETQLMEI